MKYEELADAKAVNKTISAMAGGGIEGFVVNNRAEALEKVKSLIPKSASVMNGSSRTLEEIGFVEYLKSGKHGWKNLHEEILAEKDPAKKAILRKQAVSSDYYLGSHLEIGSESEVHRILQYSNKKLPSREFFASNNSE